MANWSQKKLLLTIGGSALGVCLCAAGGVYYTSGLIEEIDLQVAEKTTAVAAADKKIAQIPGIEKDVIILRENLGEYVKILPDDRELNELLRTLQKFERQSGIRGTGLTQKNSRGGKGKGLFSPIEYSYEMTATLWQGIKFMNLIENFERFVSVTDFSIKEGKGKTGGADTIDGEVVHTIKISMRTYQYNKKGAGKEVEIPNYDDRREELREEIWKRMQAIRIARYEHPGMQGRRDIFVDPRENGTAGNNDPSNAEQRDLLDKYTGTIAELQKLNERIQDEDTTLFERYGLQKTFKTTLAQALVDSETEASMIVYRPYRLRWAQEVITPLELLRDYGPEIEAKPEADPYLAAAEITTLVNQMTDDCNNGQLEQARQRFEAVQERLSVPADDDRHLLAVEAKTWFHKASTALDFKGLDLNVQGVVVNGIGRSGVLLNGEVFEEGDYVADDLLIKMVEEEQVWFVYRGLTLVRTM